MFVGVAVVGWAVLASFCLCPECMMECWYGIAAAVVLLLVTDKLGCSRHAYRR